MLGIICFTLCLVISLTLVSVALYSGLHEKKEYRRLFNSYVANTVRFANRNSLGMAPPLACRALTMVKFPTKNGYDGLHRRVQLLKTRHPKRLNRRKIPYSID
jgi:hypothetical protein